MQSSPHPTEPKQRHFENVRLFSKNYATFHRNRDRRCWQPETRAIRFCGAVKTAGPPTDLPVPVASPAPHSSVQAPYQCAGAAALVGAGAGGYQYCRRGLPVPVMLEAAVVMSSDIRIY